MANLTNVTRVDLSGDEPARARASIHNLLRKDPEASRRVYAALSHKVWSLLIERRLDDEVRDWHSILQGVKGYLRNRDAAVSERMVALSDLLQESISLAANSPAQELAHRPHARKILQRLQVADSFVPRRELLAELNLKTSHLSNVLSQLLANNLIERRDVGKEAEFRLSARGSDILNPGGTTPVRELINRTRTMLEHNQEASASAKGPKVQRFHYYGDSLRFHGIGFTAADTKEANFRPIRPASPVVPDDLFREWFASPTKPRAVYLDRRR